LLSVNQGVIGKKEIHFVDMHRQRQRKTLWTQWFRLYNRPQTIRRFGRRFLFARAPSGERFPVMSQDQTAYLQTLLDRVLDGEAARKELLIQVCPRLEKLARVMFRQDFPALGGMHDTGSVLSESWLRLTQAWSTVSLPTVADFFRFAAHKMRQVLLDMARQYRKEQERYVRPGPVSADESADPPAEHADRTNLDPAHLAQWTEFHQRMEELPEDEKQVADLHWYMDLSFAEIARMLGTTEGIVKYRWKTIKPKLARWMPANKAS
jgi:RNA polymerase sigma factor (sigma-70 family)